MTAYYIKTVVEKINSDPKNLSKSFLPSDCFRRLNRYYLKKFEITLGGFSRVTGCFTAQAGNAVA